MTSVDLEYKARMTLLYPLAVVIVLSFGASLVFAVLTSQYTPLTVTGPLMLLLSGWAFGVTVIKGTNK